ARGYLFTNVTAKSPRALTFSSVIGDLAVCNVLSLIRLFREQRASNCDESSRARGFSFEAARNFNRLRCILLGHRPENSRQVELIDTPALYGGHVLGLQSHHETAIFTTKTFSGVRGLGDFQHELPGARPIQSEERISHGDQGAGPVGIGNVDAACFR